MSDWRAGRLRMDLLFNRCCPYQNFQNLAFAEMTGTVCTREMKQMKNALKVTTHEL